MSPDDNSLSPAKTAAIPEALAALERVIERDLDTLNYPEKQWMTPWTREDGIKVLDVLIVGGGHCGIGACFSIMREKIFNVLVIDENPEGYEGPWLTYARMPTLRTRKNVTGMELGFPNLTFKSFYEAREGLEKYAKLEKITCQEWQDYMLWMRKVLKLPFQNSTRMTAIEHDGKTFKVNVDHKGKKETLYARRIVLATGPYSLGGHNIPEAVIKGNLPKSHYAHVAEMVDFSKLKGKRIACVGAGASAFDNAGTALEAGVASLVQLIRRPLIPRLAMIRWTDWAGFLHTYADLPDPEKWRMALQVQKNHSPPPLTALKRVEKFENFRVQFGSPLLSAKFENNEITIETPKGPVVVDFLLLGTGYAFDLSKVSELKSMADKVAVWSDVYTPPDGSASERFKKSPYLGRFYEFTEKKKGTAPYLKYIYDFNQSATLSMGPTGRVSGMRYGVRRLAMGITGSFLQEDFEKHMLTAERYNDSELEGHRWAEPNPLKVTAP